MATMPAPQAATRVVASGGRRHVFGKPEKAKGGRLLVRSCDDGGGGGGGGRNGRRVGVSVEAVNGAVKLNGAAVVADVRPSVDGGGGDAFRLGKFVEGRLVYRQQFVIRSYEIGPDRTATMETIMNLLQVRMQIHSA
jgi:fatty acyl-ACP thioesterase B